MNKAILAHLSRKDPVLGGVIRAVGPRQLLPPEDCHPFQVLAQAIAHQQLNGTAANTNLKRRDHQGRRRESAMPAPADEALQVGDGGWALQLDDADGLAELLDG